MTNTADTAAYQHLTTGGAVQLHPPPAKWGSSDISIHCLGYLQYRAEPKEVEAGVGGGDDGGGGGGGLEHLCSSAAHQCI